MALGLPGTRAENASSSSWCIHSQRERACEGLRMSLHRWSLRSWSVRSWPLPNNCVGLTKCRGVILTCEALQ